MGARLAGGAGGILVALPAAPFPPPHHATAWSPFRSETLLQSLALAAFLHDGRAACWRCRWNSCRVACRPLPSAASCDSLEPIPGDESEEFQGGSLRTLFTAFPLAHQTR